MNLCRAVGCFEKFPDIVHRRLSDPFLLPQALLCHTMSLPRRLLSSPRSQRVALSSIRFGIRPAILWSLALLPHTLAILLSFRSIAHGHGPGNLVDFLGAARDMLRGRDIYNGGTGGYVYPPLIAFLYQPLGLMSDMHAGFVSLAINAAVSIFTLVLVSNVLVRRLTDTFDPRLAARVALFGALCTADKIKGEFYHLETNVFMLLAFTAAMRWVDKRPWLCGLTLGFAFNIKYLPLVLVPYLLLRRRWAAVGWFAMFSILLALLPALSMGWTANLRAWVEASGGIFRLFGIHTQVQHAAHVRLITDGVSISLTSGTGAHPSPLQIRSATADACWNDRRCLWTVCGCGLPAEPCAPIEVAFSSAAGVAALSWIVVN